MNYPGGYFAWKKAGLPVSSLDAAPETFLFSKPVKVVDGVWSSIGATAPSTYENSGHNNNLSFLITEDGVGCERGAITCSQLHCMLKSRGSPISQ